jgi:hypothetical protein
MTGPGPGAGGAQRAGSVPTRLIRAWRGLTHERRLAAAAATGLFVTLFLPWYQETVVASGVTRLRTDSVSLTGWAAFSFVEAAVLLVAAGVLFLLFTRAEDKAFHVPGGDGGVITVAGFWTCVLIVWRMFDKQGTTGHGQFATTSGIEWGIFIALGVAAFLTYAGSRIRQAHEPEPPLPGDGDLGPSGAGRTRGNRWRRAGREPAREQPRQRSRRPYAGPDMNADDTWTQPGRGGGAEPWAESGHEQAVRGRQPRGEAETRVVGEADMRVARSPQPPAPTGEPPRRIRPRSVGAPAAAPAPAPVARPRPESDDRPGSGDRPPARRPAAEPPRPARGLDRREIQDLDIAEPPAPRLGRSRPPAPNADDADADDHLTLPLDRPT